jgi:ATP-dependent DNA helicase RecG
MALKKNYIKNKLGKEFINRGPYVKAIYDSLNFELTNAQIKVLREIRNDLKSNHPMNRLIQGDVGSGKTIVAMLAASIVIGNDCQVAVMAPTEILAEQHYISFLEYCDKVNINCEILVGAHTIKEKNAIKENLENGTIQLIVGTHALIQDNVEFNNLGMIIIDEQHRFGVEHRKMLIEKGYNPEILAMTATPIPRTLAFAIHGDMDISIIDELPKNRLPIITRVVEPAKLDEVYSFMKNQMDNGRQCFIVYPLIEESEKLDLQAAEVGYKKLKSKFLKDYKLGYINGKMKKDERDQQMKQMFNNEIQCLVSTTVIEVGVNIPNATIMLIENAERFGLTQLHQLRGRVGRGIEQSYCILVKHKSTKDGSLRLDIMEKTNDGFKISDEDLKLRGPGEFFGTKQHGHLQSKLVNYTIDSKIIKHARDCAFNIVRSDPELNKKDHKGIKSQFLKNYKTMLEFVNIN